MSDNKLEIIKPPHAGYAVPPSGDQVAAPPTFVPFPRQDIDQSISARFETVVAAHPTQVAIKKGAFSVTYRELNGAANRVARALLSRSDARNEPIAVVIENTIESLAAIFGVLKAGKIFVPLDPAYSRAWTGFIIDDTQPRFILAGNAKAEALSARTGSTILNLDEIVAGDSDENPGVLISSKDLAYILYTSGSTAQPKGVAENHRNILHYVMRLTNPSKVSRADRITLVRPPSSSGALMNALLALLNGASLYPLDINAAGLTTLADWLRNERISILHCGATVFRHFAQILKDSDVFSDLRLIRLSSGQVSKADVDLFQQRFPHCVLLHVLSSTEAITYRAHFIDARFESEDGTLPVGYPVEDMEVLILDEDHNRVPLGTMGEIAIRSAFLFPGYWKNSGLTNRSFAADCEEAGRRTFLTGDLGRLRNDGCLEYCGRTDFRVKIRGHSVHLEEVEVALGKIDDVKEAVAAAKADLHGDTRLVAYIVPRAQGKVPADVLRNALKSLLPDYMIPSAFVFCAALPMLPNGKVDRQALPLPNGTRPNLATAYAAPTTTLTAEIATLWSQVLGIEPIGLHDNFFDLGGDSLLGSRIAAAIADSYGCDFTFAHLLQCATVDATAKALVANDSGCLSQSATQTSGN